MLTKSQLIAEVQAKTWYLGLIGSLTLENDYVSENVKLYRAHVMVDKTNNVITNKHIYFYVFNEGEVNEVAYYKDLSPDDQIADIQA